MGKDQLPRGILKGVFRILRIATRDENWSRFATGFKHKRTGLAPPRMHRGLERLGCAVLVATASAFLRDHRRSPWAFPRGWTNPRRSRSKFVVATKPVSSPP